MGPLKLALLLLISLGCAQIVRVSPVGCPSPGEWGAGLGGEAFEIEQKVWVGVGEKTLELEDLLRPHKITCTRLNGVSLEWKTTTGDALTHLIPFLKRQTLVIRGTHAGLMEEELPASGAN